MELGFMQGIGGDISSYSFDIEASKKLDDINSLIVLIEEGNSKNEEYCRGVRDTLKTIKEIINE